MIYLTAEQVLFIHARLIAETGGSQGLRDLSLLESAIARPQATFDGKELYSGAFMKAAALLESLVNNHPFVDGNKRTGIAAAALFLRANGWRLSAQNAELEKFSVQVVVSHLKIETIAAWLRQHCRKN